MRRPIRKPFKDDKLTKTHTCHDSLKIRFTAPLVKGTTCDVNKHTTQDNTVTLVASMMKGTGHECVHILNLPAYMLVHCSFFCTNLIRDN